jgi:hypothetical protein
MEGDIWIYSVSEEMYIYIYFWHLLFCCMTASEVHPAVIDLRTKRTPVIWVAGCSTRWWGTGARNKLKTEEGIPTASVHQFHQPIEQVQLSTDVRPSYADIKSCNLVSCKIRGLSCPAQSFKREREHCNAIMLNLQINSHCWVLTLQKMSFPKE